jgi:transcriptional regulator with XRE-family HTH domain
MLMDMKVFAERLKTARSERNITATELAEALGINKATVYRYENAEIGKVKTVTINAIADYLNVNPDYLIGATDNKHTVKEAEDLLNSITDGEKALLEMFRRVPVDDQQMVLDMIKIALKQSQ